MAKDKKQKRKRLPFLLSARRPLPFLLAARKKLTRPRKEEEGEAPTLADSDAGEAAAAAGGDKESGASCDRKSPRGQAPPAADADAGEAAAAAGCGKEEGTAGFIFMCDGKRPPREQKGRAPGQAPPAADADEGEAAAAAGEGKQSTAGFIFMCDGKTKPECFRYRVFGLPKGKSEAVKRIEEGTSLFLFDVEFKLLYGVYEATSRGRLDLEAAIFGGKFPSQVNFKIVHDCLPLPEGSFKHAIQENYRRKRFKPGLNSQQVQILLSLFQSIKTTHSSIRPAVADRHFLPPDEQYRLGGYGPHRSPDVASWSAMHVLPHLTNHLNAPATQMVPSSSVMEPLHVPSAGLQLLTGAYYPSVSGTSLSRDTHHQSMGTTGLLPPRGAHYQTATGLPPRQDPYYQPATGDAYYQHVTRLPPSTGAHYQAATHLPPAGDERHQPATVLHPCYFSATGLPPPRDAYHQHATRLPPYTDAYYQAATGLPPPGDAHYQPATRLQPCCQHATGLPRAGDAHFHPATTRFPPCRQQATGLPHPGDAYYQPAGGLHPCDSHDPASTFDQWDSDNNNSENPSY